MFDVRYLLRKSCRALNSECRPPRVENLLKLLDRCDHLVEIGPVAGIELGVKELAIGANFKGTAAGWNQGQRFDAFTEFENFRRQTDGLGRVVSNHAILDRDFGFH
jgi:hypothetical protein